MTALALAALLVLIALNGLFVAAEFALVRSRRSKIEQLAAEGSRGATPHPAPARQHRRIPLRLPGRDHDGLDRDRLPRRAGNRRPGRARLRWPLARSRHRDLVRDRLLPRDLAPHNGGEQVPKLVAISRAERTAVQDRASARLVSQRHGSIHSWLSPRSPTRSFGSLGVKPAELEEKHTSEDLQAADLPVGGRRRSRPGRGDDAQRRLPPPRAGGEGDHDPDPGGGHRRLQLATVTDALKLCWSSGHNRLVVVDEGNADRVRGIVHALRLARLLMSEGGDTPIEEAVREALIVPETKPLDDLLTELQRQRSSIGVVVDEYGRTVGVVTVEDILEEVVGEIEDETDPLAGSLRQLIQRRLVRPRPRLARRPLGPRDRAAGRHRCLQLDRRLRLRRARPAAEAGRRDQRRRLRDPGRVRAREPDRRGSDPPSRHLDRR